MRFLRKANLGRILSLLMILVSVALAPSAAWAKPRVPGTNELIVIHPDMDKDGLPAVDLRRDGDSLMVDIPPTVHIHRFYYNIDKEYQGPVVTGGPTVVAAKHPRTDEWKYVQVELPAGAPVIEYDKHSITYAYREQSIVIRFSHHWPDKITIKHRSGRDPRSDRQRREEHRERVQNHLQGSRLLGAIKDAAGQTADLAAGAAGTAQELAANAIQTASGVLTALPGFKTLQGATEDRFQREHDERLRQAQQIADEQTTRTVRTLR